MNKVHSKGVAGYAPTVLAAGFALAIALTIGCAGSNPPAQVIVCTGGNCPQPETAKGKEKTAAEKAAAQQGARDVKELESACAQIRMEQIDCIVGIGESSLESAARDQSAFDARSQYAISLQSKVKVESEQITSTTGREAQIAFEQKASEAAEQTLSRAFAYAIRTTYDGTYYKVYTLMVVNPEDIKEILEVAAAKSGNEEVMVQVKSPEAQSSFMKKITIFKDIVLPILKRLI